MQIRMRHGSGLLAAGLRCCCSARGRACRTKLTVTNWPQTLFELGVTAMSTELCFTCQNCREEAEEVRWKDRRAQDHNAKAASRATTATAQAHTCQPWPAP